MYLDNPVRVVDRCHSGACGLIVIAVAGATLRRFILKSLRRNLLRTMLTGLATMVLVLVVTLVWTILALLDQETAAKSKNLKAIVTEQYQIPSQMPYAYAASLCGGARKKGDYPCRTTP